MKALDVFVEDELPVGAVPTYMTQSAATWVVGRDGKVTSVLTPGGMVRLPWFPHAGGLVEGWAMALLLAAGGGGVEVSSERDAVTYIEARGRFGIDAYSRVPLREAGEFLYVAKGAGRVGRSRRPWRWGSSSLSWFGSGFARGRSLCRRGLNGRGSFETGPHLRGRLVGGGRVDDAQRRARDPRGCGPRGDAVGSGGPGRDRAGGGRPGGPVPGDVGGGAFGRARGHVRADSRGTRGPGAERGSGFGHADEPGGAFAVRACRGGRYRWVTRRTMGSAAFRVLTSFRVGVTFGAASSSTTEVTIPGAGGGSRSVPPAAWLARTRAKAMGGGNPYRSSALVPSARVRKPLRCYFGLHRLSAVGIVRSRKFICPGVVVRFYCACGRRLGAKEEPTNRSASVQVAPGWDGMGGNDV